MTDRLVNATWNALVLGLIAVLGVATAVLAYSGALSLFAGRWWDAGPAITGAAAIGLAEYLLCYFRSDLVYG